MAETDLEHIHELSKAFERWKWLIPPIGDLRDAQRDTYAIEVDLDHEISHLAELVKRALSGDTRTNWPNIIPECLADLETIERNVQCAPISEEAKKKYKDYISECRSLYEKMGQLPVPAEGHLGFRREVLSRFGFLEEYGFQVTETSPIRVRYESPHLFLELSHQPSAPELSLELGEIRCNNSRRRSFSLDDLFFWAGQGTKFNYSRFHLGSREGLADFIKCAARFAATYADAVLRNDPFALNSLLKKQAERERLITGDEES